MPKEGDYPPLSPKELVKIYEKHFWFLSLPRQLLPLDAVLLGISETKKKKPVISFLTLLGEALGS